MVFFALLIRCAGETKWRTAMKKHEAMVLLCFNRGFCSRTIWRDFFEDFFSLHPHSNVNGLSENFFLSCWLFLLLPFVYVQWTFLFFSVFLLPLHDVSLTAHHCTLDNDISIKHYFCFIFSRAQWWNGAISSLLDMPQKVKLLFRLLLTSFFLLKVA